MALSLFLYRQPATAPRAANTFHGQERTEMAERYECDTRWISDRWCSLSPSGQRRRQLVYPKKAAEPVASDARKNHPLLRRNLNRDDHGKCTGPRAKGLYSPARHPAPGRLRSRREPE
ncbi:UNVERIFIED_CONTAM: hypothetical protein HHA_455050 [Hammondia hammondi]|eukprot:XP_008888795.1 hypothetical protein HHA_455050 [Hammondia hammondi]